MELKNTYKSNIKECRIKNDIFFAQIENLSGSTDTLAKQVSKRFLQIFYCTKGSVTFQFSSENKFVLTEGKSYLIFQAEEEKTLHLSLATKSNLSIVVVSTEELLQLFSKSLFPVEISREEQLLKSENISTTILRILADIRNHNFKKDIKGLENITLLNVDSLSKLVDESISQRKAEIPKAKNIVNTSMNEFKIWEENRKFAPIISSFKDELHRLSNHNYKKIQKENPQVNGVEKELSNKLVQKMTNRFAEYILENPDKAKETAKIFKDIFHLDQK